MSELGTGSQVGPESVYGVLAAQLDLWQMVASLPKQQLDSWERETNSLEPTSPVVLKIMCDCRRELGSSGGFYCAYTLESTPLEKEAPAGNMSGSLRH